MSIILCACVVGQIKSKKYKNNKNSKNCFFLYEKSQLGNKHLNIAVKIVLLLTLDRSKRYQHLNMLNTYIYRSTYTL